MSTFVPVGFGLVVFRISVVGIGILSPPIEIEFVPTFLAGEFEFKE